MSGLGILPSTGPMSFRMGPRLGPRLPFELPAPPPRLPMPAPRPMPMPAPRPTQPLPAPRPVPQPLPLPQTQPQAKPRVDAPPTTADRTREAERDCQAKRDKDCVKCPPEQGSMTIPNNGKGHSMSARAALYQAWVTAFPTPYEWWWNNTWWDGFDKPRCTLLEAKANYAFMFIPLIGLPRPWANVEKTLIIPAERHSLKARPSPPVAVEWHFLQRVVYEYCAEQYAERGLTNLTAYWNPMPGTKDHDQYIEQRAKEQKEWEEYRRENPDRVFEA